MAQVYRFTDENGQVRLFAEITPDPAFNGGTITTPLEIDNPGSAASLVVKDSAGVTVFSMDDGGAVTMTPDVNIAPGIDSLNVYAQAGSSGARPLRIYDKTGTLVWYIGSDGAVTASGDETRGNATLGSDGSAYFQAGAGGSAPSLRLRAPSATKDSFEARNSSGVGKVFVDHGGALILSLNTEPDDADLDANECALWFDPTDGVAALNIKAKQADGTVKTATIPVIT